ncbi:hypothetical protein R3P38DRAFT_15969 [Favolaschia claudopus]|uniref:F-box domain-containing protein n=1 Tax=Favolaschia claudopus TaxID=2862362 RepID=A0AAW0EI62_9AGAR
MATSDVIHTASRIGLRSNGSHTLPPIYSLPYELLAQIMLLAMLPPAREHRPYPVASWLFVLCHVCSLWRQVAFNTPRLWTIDTFPIYLRGNLEEEENAVDYFPSSAASAMFLQHSTLLPIRVYLFQSREMYTKLTVDSMAKLLSAAPRWQTLEIVWAAGWEEFNSKDLARMPPVILASLEDLILQSVGPEMWQDQLDIFLSAPRLRRVTFEGKDIPPLPWSQLTRLSLNHDSPQPCLDIIVHCVNIIHLSVTTKQWAHLADPNSYASATSGLLPRLEVLDMRLGLWSSGDHLNPFLETLKLPALKSLSLALRPPYGEDNSSVSWLTPSLLSFLAHCPDLKQLTVDNCDSCIYSEDVPVILQRTPNLTKLSFVESELDDDFFTILTYEPRQPESALVPHLETLELFEVGDQFSEESLIEMVKSRWWADEEQSEKHATPGVVRLKHLAVLNYVARQNLDVVDFTPQLRDVLAVYQNQGLDVKI